MPSFTIHIIIANEYYKKNKKEIKNYKEFIDGTIAPDLCTDKITSHYEMCNKCNTNINFALFFRDSRVDMSSDFWKGYFLHLVTDHLFYNYYFKQEYNNAIDKNESLYEDYFILNSKLIDGYKIDPIDRIKKFMITKKGECKYLNYNKIKIFIDEIYNTRINDYISQLNK